MGKIRLSSLRTLAIITHSDSWSITETRSARLMMIFRVINSAQSFSSFYDYGLNKWQWGICSVLSLQIVFVIHNQDGFRRWLFEGKCSIMKSAGHCAL